MVFGLTDITDTKAITLKTTIEIILAKHGLSISKLHRQGCDGTSNMQGEINGLKKYFLK